MFRYSPHFILFHLHCNWTKQFSPSSHFSVFACLQVVYDHGPVDVKYELFSDLKVSVEKNWSALPRSYDAVTPELRAKMKQIVDGDKAEAAKKAAAGKK